MAKERPEVHPDFDATMDMTIYKIVQKSLLYGSNIFMQGWRSTIDKVVVRNPHRFMRGGGILPEGVSIIETYLSVLVTNESAISMYCEVFSIGIGLSLGKEVGGIRRSRIVV